MCTIYQGHVFRGCSAKPASEITILTLTRELDSDLKVEICSAWWGEPPSKVPRAAINTSLILSHSGHQLTFKVLAFATITYITIDIIIIIKIRTSVQ